MTADSKRVASTAHWRRFAAALAALTLVLALFVVFTGRTEHRAQALASEDGRWCVFSEPLRRSLAIGRSAPASAPFRTFSPPIATPTAPEIFGVWDHAHDVFLEGLLAFGLPFVGATALVYAALGAALIHGARVRHRLNSCRSPVWLPLSWSRCTQFVDFSLQIPGVAVYVAAAMGAAVAVSLRRDDGNGAGRRGLHNHTV